MDRRLVLVIWQDAAGGHREGWRPIASMTPNLIECRTTGYLIHMDERSILIVPHVSADGDGDGEITIPTPWARVIDLEERHE